MTALVLGLLAAALAASAARPSPRRDGRGPGRRRAAEQHRTPPNAAPPWPGRAPRPGARPTAFSRAARGVASEASLAGLGGNERPPGVEAPVPPTRHARRPAGLALEPSLGRGGLQAALEALVPALGRVRRRRELEAAVPEALDVLRATVAAGVGPSRALQAAAESTSAPLGRLLDQARRLAELGGGAGQALAAVARSNDLAELALAGEALALAETTGAPPGPVLAGVAAAAADRVRARQARLAATAEARLSARVVAGMAPAFLLVLAATSPSDVAFLVREPLGWAALTAAAALEALGAWWASRIVRAVE